MNFNPTRGREQANERPAIVLSPERYNRRFNLCVVCPITTTERPFPFFHKVPEGLAISGWVICDQVKSISWPDRDCRYADAAPDELISHVVAKVTALIDPD